MIEFNMLPIYRQGINELSEGLEIHIPEFCKKNCEKNTKCINHYKEIFTQGAGLYICPYGFNTYYDNESNDIIFSCFRVKDKYDKKKADPKIKDEAMGNNYYRIIELEALNSYVKAYNIFHENNQRYDDYNTYVEDILHDIRKYNAQLKAKIDRLYRKMEGNKRKYYDMLEITKSIYEIAWFFTLRINAYDFLYNENLSTAIPPAQYNIYSIFYKIKECIKEYASGKNINIHLNANRECREIKAYECIELLPYILLENAIKYAPRNTDVNIYIEEHAKKSKISVSSIGPFVDRNELKKIFIRGFRGANAQEHTKEGQGIGLYTAKKICDLHNLKYSIDSSDNIIQKIKNIKYSEFKVDIELNM